ncbi:MAG: HU family DNA-binding protein [Clostridia bacterium]|nr:HU family DNA-binding protein [Clostridia bacterium]
MNKQDFLKLWADKTGMTNKAAGETFEAFVDTVAEALKKDKKIQFIGFGNFELKTKPARKGVLNPLTKKTYDVPASNAPAFRVATKFKERFN